MNNITKNSFNNESKFFEEDEDINDELEEFLSNSKLDDNNKFNESISFIRGQNKDVQTTNFESGI